jgi:hypothetical protein
MTMISSSSGSKGVDLGCISGIPIHLQYSCFTLVGIEVLAVMWQYHEPIFTVLMFTLYGPVLLGTILIVSFGCVKRIPYEDSFTHVRGHASSDCPVSQHELGHALTTKRLGKSRIGRYLGCFLVASS